MRVHRKTIWFLTVGLALTILIVVLVLNARPGSRKSNRVEQLDFPVGSTLSGYPLVGEDGNELDIADIPGGDKLLIFAWDKCGDCKAEYDSYRLLFPLFDSQALNIAFVWDDAIPGKDLAAMGIPDGNSYSADGRYKFTDWVPSYLLVDGEGIVRMRETDLGKVAARLREAYPANPETVARLFPGEDVLVGVDRCAGCKSAYDDLERQGASFRYLLQGENASGLYDGDSLIYPDPHSLLSAALKIKEYPALVQTNGDGSVKIKYSW